MPGPISPKRGSRFKDLSGKTFGRLTVLGLARPGKRHRHCYFLCRCRCGAVKEIASRQLSGGGTRSCGCLRAETHSTHGKTKTKEWRAWKDMVARCHKEGHPEYADYGGRGIVVCQRWRESAAVFLADMGACPSRQHSLDRIDNDGDYCPENCRWATKKEQARNMRTSRFIRFRDETCTIAEWSERLGIPHSTIRRRLRSGWSVERALGTPPDKKYYGRRTRMMPGMTPRIG